MPWQLIYTSAPRGLLSGQSGFCTVARSSDLREALVQRLEQLSSYHYLRVAEAATANRNPTVCAFRILDLRGSKYHVLTRIQPCGLDFTSRTNHLAHHLVFQGSELAQLPSPAAILRHWSGWLSSWQGEPRLLTDVALDAFGAAAKSCLPAQTWMRMTGDAGRAAGLLESEYVRGCYLVCPPGSEGQVLEMFCETLELKNFNGKSPLRPWVHPFTTFLQAEDNPADFQWRACQEGTPAYQQAAQRTIGLIALRSVRVPNNSLVKVAREGLKPPSPSPKAETQTSLGVRRQLPGQRATGMELSDTGHWRKPAQGPAKPAFDINIPINVASLARIAIVVALLLVLWHFRPHKPHQPPETAPETATNQSAPPPAPPVIHPENTENPAAVETSPNAPPSNEPHPTPPPPPNPAQLDSLSSDGPTYVFTAPNLMDFDLPIDSIIRFQNLIQRFDNYSIPTTNIQLSLNTDEWGYSAGARMTATGTPGRMLSGINNTGIECFFTYSDWQNTRAVAVHTTFPASPKAFWVHFGFSASNSGDPFRLLIVNESNAPVPIQLSMQWLKANHPSVRASLDPRLDELLSTTNFILPRGLRWQLQPFIKDGSQTNYLYKDWPSNALPPLGDELDFVEARRLIRAQQLPLSNKVAALYQKLEKQKEQAGLDVPVGQYLGLSANGELASFSAFAKEGAPIEFIEYLNHLKKRLEIRRWPLLYKEDDDATLTDKFQQIYDCCIEQNSITQSKLLIDNDNYFSTVWRRLKDIEKTQQEQQRAKKEIDNLRRRRNAVPGTLDKVAYVRLVIIDPPKPSLEMIRFQGP
jgi:hypothetical protein